MSSYVNITQQTPSPNKPPLPFYLRLFGVCSLGCVVLMWTLSNFSTEKVARTYKHVFLVNMLYACGLQTYFVFLKFKDPIKQLRARYADDGADDAKDNPDEGCLKTSLKPFTTLEHAKLAVVFSLFYLAGNISMIYAFSHTSVFAASLMACTSSLWTLLFSRIFGVCKVSVMKIASVIITIAAVTYFNWHDLMAAEELKKMTLLGNGLGVLSAIFYGAYSTYLKVASKGDESRISYALLFAFSGLYASIIVGPGCAILHFGGWEAFQLPDLQITKLIILNSLFGTVVPNYLWNAAFLFTSPISVAIGLCFMTPLSLFVGWIQNELTIRYYHIVATLLMMCGFMLINFADIYSDRDIQLF
jgi:solute carrier family 35 protein F5